MGRCCRLIALTAVACAWAAPPASARIAFVSERDGEPEIYVMNDDGSSARDLTGNPASPDLAPAWSPDAKRIVFQRGFGSDADLWVMDADGSDQKALVGSTAADKQPSWSPDGRQIAFVSDRVNGDDHLYVAGADGTGAVQL